MYVLALVRVSEWRKRGMGGGRRRQFVCVCGLRENEKVRKEGGPDDD